MKCARIVLVVLAAFASIANAMPTPEQAKKAEPLVLKLMGECQAALKSGAKTRTEVAAYAKRGIRHFTTFAVSVDDDYVKDFGTDSLFCVKEYGRILKEVLG